MPGKKNSSSSNIVVFPHFISNNKTKKNKIFNDSQQSDNENEHTEDDDEFFSDYSSEDSTNSKTTNQLKNFLSLLVLDKSKIEKNMKENLFNKTLSENESSDDDENNVSEQETNENEPKKNYICMNAKTNTNANEENKYLNNQNYREKLQNNNENENDFSPINKNDKNDKNNINELNYLLKLISDKKSTLELLKLNLNKNENDESLSKCIEIYTTDIKNIENEINKKENKKKSNNIEKFKKNLHESLPLNDCDYFNKLEMVEQNKILKKLEDINNENKQTKPFRIRLIESNIPNHCKLVALKKINTFKQMNPGSSEYYKTKTWIDTFMNIPFNKYCSLPIHISDGIEISNNFLLNANDILNKAVYGLSDAKMQFMQLIGQWVSNPNSVGTAIAVYGPPGTGKTSLIKEGISKILNRPFEFVALGGSTNSGFLEGFSYTYESSRCGKIVQMLINCKCMNPIIYFDELDKISSTPNGEEIANVLTHLTDTTQNSHFHDKYFTDVDFDLSKCLFIFSYNDETKISPILKDRMYKIKVQGYSKKEKITIGTKYLLPKILTQFNFKENDIIFNDETFEYIIDKYCDKEEGVRNLKRCIETICSKINLCRLVKPESNILSFKLNVDLKNSTIVNNKMVDVLLHKPTEDLSWTSMYL